MAHSAVQCNFVAEVIDFGQTRVGHFEKLTASMQIKNANQRKKIRKIKKNIKIKEIKESKKKAKQIKAALPSNHRRLRG